MGGMRGPGTIRSLVTIVLAFVVPMFLYANNSDPVYYTIKRSAPGKTFVLGRDSMLIHLPRPIWSNTASSLLLASVYRDTIYKELRGLDIRAVTPWHGNVLALHVGESTCTLLRLRNDLKIIDSMSIGVDVRNAENIVVELLADRKLPYALLRIGDAVWAVTSEFTLVEIDRGVRGVGIAHVLESDEGSAAVVTDVGSVAYLTVLNSALQRAMSPSVPLADEAIIESTFGKILVLTPIDDRAGVQVTMVDPVTSASRYVTLNVSPYLVAPIKDEDTKSTRLAVVVLRNGRHELVVSEADNYTIDNVVGTPLPSDMGLPLRIRVVGDTVVIICTAGMVTALPNGDIQSRDAFTGTVEPQSCDVVRIEQGYLVSSDKGSYVVEKHGHLFWWLWKSINTLITYVIPLTLALAFAIVVYLLRRQRRFVNAMIDLPAAGIVFLLDSNGRLQRINDSGARLLQVSKNIPMRRQFRSYMLHEGMEPMIDFLTTVTASRVSMSSKISIVEKDATRELVCTSVPLRGTFGRNRGSLVTCVDITEALERRRLVNWAQLAHDMQTNLSTIRLNAERLEESDQRSRILFQAGVLIQRVRDLVSVGRSEELNRSIVHSAELCTELRHEFDPAMFSHVTFSMKLRGTLMNVDRLKVSRALRNAIENGIKAMRGQPGTIELATWFDRSNVYIKVSDTGVGMEPDVLQNMMKPYFTTAKDGTGTGIGTMIMQHVVQLHGGSIRVTSEPGVGTQIVFRFPHGMEGPRLRNARWAVEEEEA